jgi:hypothetical protein
VCDVYRLFLVNSLWCGNFESCRGSDVLPVLDISASVAAHFFDYDFLYLFRVATASVSVFQDFSIIQKCHNADFPSFQFLNFARLWKLWFL